MPRIFDFEILTDTHILTCTESILNLFEMVSVCVGVCMYGWMHVNLFDISRTEQHLKLKNCLYAFRDICRFWSDLSDILTNRVEIMQV